MASRAPFLKKRKSGSNGKETQAANEELTKESESALSPFELTRNGKLEELKTLAVKTQSQCLLAIDSKGRTLLHVASESGRTDIMHYLISSGVVNLNAQDEDGSTALHLAVDSKHTGTVDLLLKCGANSMIKNRDNDPPLHIALRSPDFVDIVSSFAKYPESLTGRGHDNCTALHVIAEYDNLEALDILHGVSASVNPQNTQQDILQLHADNKHGMAAIHLAARKGSHRVLDFMISESVHHGALTPKEVVGSLSKENSMPLHFAVESGHLKVVEVLLKYGASPVATKGNHLPPIHLACSQNRLGMVKAMVRKLGPDILNHRDQRSGKTPLHCSASSLCSIDMFSYLLEKGSYIDCIDDHCYTPLQNAIHLGNLTAVDYLLKRGSNPLIRNKQGHNCLHSAVICKRKEIFKTIIGSPQSSRMSKEQDEKGDYPIHLALKLGLNTFIVPLLQCATSPLYDAEGNNYLHLAALAGDYKSLLCVLSMEFSDTMLNEPNARGQSPLHLTAVSNSLLIIKELVDRGAVVHKCYGGLTPFMHACSLGKFEAAKALYQSHPFQRDWFDINGSTALHLAVDGGDPDSLTFCLDVGVPVTLNNAGLTFLDKILENLDTALACATINHKRWQECLDFSSPTKKHPILRLISSIPEAFAIVLNKSIEKSSLDSNHPNYWEQYNFKYLFLSPNDCKEPPQSDILKDSIVDSQSSGNSKDEQDIELHPVNTVEDSDTPKDLKPTIEHIQVHMETPITNNEIPSANSQPIKKPNKRSQPDTKSTILDQEHNDDAHSSSAGDEELSKDVKSLPLLVLKKLIKYKHKECLTHPVVVTYLNLKWNGYARWLYVFQFIALLVYTIFLSMFIWVTPPPLQEVTPVTENTTDSTIGLTSNAIRFTTLFLAFTKTLMWTIQCYVLRKHLFTYFTKEFYFWSTGISMLCTYIFLIPWRGLDHVLWEAGVFAIFFAWIAVALSFQVHGQIGIYVTMLISTTKSVLKVFCIVVIFLCAFAFPLYILIGTVSELQHTSIGLSFFSVFGSLLAAIDYANVSILESSSQLRYSALVFIFFIILSVMMPIVVINLLIGIAVGDITNIQQQAIISRLTLKVDSLSKVHRLLSEDMIQKVTKMSYKRFPNKKRSFIKKLWLKVSGQDQDLERDTTTTGDVELKDNGNHEQVKSLTTKLEQLTLHQYQQVESLKRVEDMLAKLIESQRVGVTHE